MGAVKTATRTRSRDIETSLLHAADVVLRRDGLEGFTVRAVATEAGVAPMGVYSRFGSKEGLVDALLVAALDGARQEIAGHEFDSVERMRGSARRYRQWALVNPQHYKAIFLSRSSLTSAGVAAALAAAYEAGCANIEYAMARGTLRADDVSEVTRRFWCATHGAITFELHNLIVTDDADRMFESVVDMVILGLSAPPPSSPSWA